jgi:hypothetical protein
MTGPVAFFESRTTAHRPSATSTQLVCGPSLTCVFHGDSRDTVVRWSEVPVL